MAISPENIKKRIANNIRTLRRSRGLTQEALAYHAGIATRHLQKIEAAEVNLTIETISKLCSAFGIDPVDLLKR